MLSDTDTDASTPERPTKRTKTAREIEVAESEDEAPLASPTAKTTTAKKNGKAKEKAPPAPKAPKAYVPVARSGAYGILLALWAVTEDAVKTSTDPSLTSGMSNRDVGTSNEVYLTKIEIIQLASNWCDSDYLTANRGSSRDGTAHTGRIAPAGSVGPAARQGRDVMVAYTAWASMKTLIHKGYVYQTGSPARFCLSDEGLQVTQSMAVTAGLRRSPSADTHRGTRGGESAASSSRLGPTLQPAIVSDSEGELTSTQAARRPMPRLKVPATLTARNTSRSISPVETPSTYEAPRPSRPALQPPAPPKGAFLYTYLSAAAQPVLARAEAAVRLSDIDYAETYSIRFSAGLQSHAIVKSGSVEMVQVDPKAAGMCKGFIRGETSNERAPGLERRTGASVGMEASGSGVGSMRNISGEGTPIVLLDDSDDDANTGASATAKAAQKRKIAAVEVDDDQPVVETVTIGSGFLGYKDRLKLNGSSTKSKGPTLNRSLSDVTGRVTSKANRDEPELFDKWDMDAGEDFLQELGASVEATESQMAAGIESQVESQGSLLVPRGPYMGLYSESQAKDSHRFVRDPATGQQDSRRTKSDSALAQKRAARKPRLSGLVPPPAIGISWHNALIPTATLSRNASSKSAATLNQERERERVAEEHGFEPPRFEPLIVPAGTFSIHLLIDTREVRSRGQAHSRSDEFADALRKMGIPAETRALPLGDAVWIARRNDGGKGEEDEFVLDFVVERKRLDDLNHSIKDGRWREQKFRLSSSGISHIVYIIEDFDTEQQWSMFGESLQTALSSTQIVDGYFVERTASVEQTLKHLATMHSVVEEMWSVSGKFSEFEWPGY